MNKNIFLELEAKFVGGTPWKLVWVSPDYFKKMINTRPIPFSHQSLSSQSVSEKIFQYLIWDRGIRVFYFTFIE